MFNAEENKLKSKLEFGQLLTKFAPDEIMTIAKMFKVSVLKEDKTLKDGQDILNEIVAAFETLQRPSKRKLLRLLRRASRMPAHNADTVKNRQDRAEVSTNVDRTED